MRELCAYRFLSHCAQGSWHGMEKCGASDTAGCVTSHDVTTRDVMRTGNPRKLKLGEHVDTDLGYLHTKFHFVTPTHLGMA